MSQNVLHPCVQLEWNNSCFLLDSVSVKVEWLIVIIAEDDNYETPGPTFVKALSWKEGPA